MKIESKSEVGYIRNSNQDRVLTLEKDNYFLGLVCDGIGGGLAGDVASEITISIFREAFLNETISNPKYWFRDTIERANDALIYEAYSNEELKGMGTTCIAVIIHNNRAIGFNVGDSRLYDYRHDTLSLLSQDQTYANLLYLQNEITYDEALNHPKRNRLMNAVGIHDEIYFETIYVPDGWERLMLCSDGLSDYVDHFLLEETFNLDLENTASKLLELALEAGGFDNVSLVLVEGDLNG